jgi:biopolymer transport protein ExbD/biopolymer transport protein TolR
VDHAARRAIARRRDEPGGGVSTTAAAVARRRARRAVRAMRRAPGDIGDVLDIPMTPMIDVMMCLLVIFMIITPIITYYGAKVPVAANPQRESIDDAVSMGIRRDGTFIIGKQAVPRDQLARRLAVLYDRRPGDYLLYLWADADVEYPVVLDAIDAARTAGVRTVGAIVTPRPDAGKP